MTASNIFHRYDDGYIVRRMTKEDASFALQGFVNLDYLMPKHDLEISLAIFSEEKYGFYVGEIDGKVVASTVRIPWSDSIAYGSYYYVDTEHRGKGYGTRLRDEVARKHVGSRMLCIDAVMGKVASDNRLKYGYSDEFLVGRFEGPALTDVVVRCDGKSVHKVDDTHFEEAMAYDDKNFVQPGLNTRRKFMKRWFKIPGGVSYLVKDEQGHVIGLGCRRPCVQENAHQIGPLYADSLEIAEVLVKELSSDIPGEHLVINMWPHHPNISKLVKKFKLTKSFDMQHMHINGQAHKHNPSLYGITSVDVCGF